MEQIKTKLLNPNSKQQSISPTHKLLLDPNTCHVLVDTNLYARSNHKILKPTFLNNIKNNFFNGKFKLHIPSILMKLVCLVTLTDVKNINTDIEMFINTKTENANLQNEDGDTALHLLLKQTSNNLGLESIHLAMILIKYIDCNIQNNQGQTPLHLYCNTNHDSDIILESLVKRTNVNIKDFHGYTALKYCVSLASTTNLHDKSVLIHYLIKHGSLFSFDDLHISSVDALKDLIEKNIIRLHDLDEHGENLIFYAIRHLNLTLLEYLIFSKVETTIADKQGITLPILVDSLKSQMQFEDYEKIIQLLDLANINEIVELTKKK